MSSTWVRAASSDAASSSRRIVLAIDTALTLLVPERGKGALDRRTLGIEHPGHVRDVDPDREPHSSSPYQASKLRPLTCS